MAVEMTKEEAKTVRWALRYMAQGLGEKHKATLLKNEGWTESGYGERAARLMLVADRIEEEYELTIFD